MEYLPKPRSVIQRVFGSEVRLANAEPTYFIDGTCAGPGVLRRRVWDKSLAYGDYQPTALPWSHTILTYRDDTINKKDYDDF